MDPRPSSEPLPPPEHVFGTIHPITVPIEWAPTPSNPRKKPRKAVDAMTESWSVNGAGFTAATNPAVKESAILTITIGPVTGEAVVRTVRAVDGAADTTYYGVEFISDDLQTVARDLISIHLRHHPERHEDAPSPLEIEDPSQPRLSDWT